MTQQQATPEIPTPTDDAQELLRQIQLELAETKPDWGSISQRFGVVITNHVAKLAEMNVPQTVVTLLSYEAVFLGRLGAGLTETLERLPRVEEAVLDLNLKMK